MRHTTIISLNSTLILLFLLSLMVVGLLVGVGVWQIFLFCLVNITGVLFPGFFLLRCSGFRFKNTTSTLLTAYGVGFAGNAVLYAVLLICGIQHLSGWVLWVLSAMCVLSFFVRRVRHDLTDILKGSNRDILFLQVLFLVLLAFCFVLFQQPLLSVEFTGYQDIPYDQMYWMKNCVAATKDFPLPELSVSGYNMYWHMFSCFNIALFHFATDIDIFNLCFSLSYVWNILLLIGGAYALASELMTDRRYVFIVLILMLLCSSAEYHTDVLYLIHLWYCTMGTPEAIASELFAFLLLLKAIEGQRVNGKSIPLVALLAATAVGYKSPVGIVLLVGVGCMLFVLSLKNRAEIVPSLTVLLIIAIMSLVVIMVFVASNQTLTSPNSNNQVTLTFRTVTQMGIMQEPVSLLTNWGVEIHVAALLLAIPCLLLVHPVMLLLVVVLVAFFVMRKRICFSDDIISLALMPLLAMCLVGMGAFLALTHYGFAQSYFLYAVIPLAVVFSVVSIEKCFSQNRGWYCYALYLFVGCSFLIMPACAFTYELDEEFRHAPAQVSREGTSLTTKEWEGLFWAREHLPDSAVIVTNKVLAPSRGNRSYITSSYAERQVYFEGYISANLPNDHIAKDRIRLIAKYFSGDLKAREELLEEGVTHVVVFKSLSDIDRTVVSWGGGTNILVFNSLSQINLRRGRTLYENEEIKVTTL